MDIVVHTGDVPNALLLMLLGMVGIFVVMGVILLAISLLNKYAKDKKTKNSDTNK